MTSPTAFEKMSEQERRSHPVGTGPFKLLEWVPNDHVTLVRNEHYWKKGLPYLDKVTFKVLNDPISQVTALKAGEVDMLNSMSPELVRGLRQNKNLTVLGGLQTTPMAAMLQVTRPPSMTYASAKPSAATALTGRRSPRRLNWGWQNPWYRWSRWTSKAMWT